MEYIISEEELKAITCWVGSEYAVEIQAEIDRFIKDKKPVTEIASGEVKRDLGCLPLHFIGDVYFEDIAEKYINKTITIYVEVK